MVTNVEEEQENMICTTKLRMAITAVDDVDYQQPDNTYFQAIDSGCIITLVYYFQDALLLDVHSVYEIVSRKLCECCPTIVRSSMSSICNTTQ